MIFFLQKFHKNLSPVHLLKKSPVHLLISSKFSNFTLSFQSFHCFFLRNPNDDFSFFVGDIGCYTLAYARNIGLGIIQVHSFYVVLFRYMCLFHLDLLQRFSISSKVSVKSMAFERDSLKNICVLLGLC